MIAGEAAIAGSGRRYWKAPTARSRNARYGSGRRKSPLTPVECRPEDGLGQFQDLSLARKAFEGGFAEENPIIEDHLKTPFGRTLERKVTHDRSPGAQDVSGQADRLVEVVSGNAILDDNAVLGLQHAATIPPVGRPAARPARSPSARSNSECRNADSMPPARSGRRAAGVWCRSALAPGRC